MNFTFLYSTLSCFASSDLRYEREFKNLPELVCYETDRIVDELWK